MVVIAQHWLLPMRKPLYIYSFSNFYHAVEDELPLLKPILLAASGKKIRRIDRLTQLALIGSFQCKSNFALPEKTGLYMSSIYGSINNTCSVLTDIYQHGQLPRPLNFINTVSNAACFYLAEQLGLLANNQFITRDHFTLEAAIKLASIDLEIGNVDAALVGMVCEVGEDLEIHRQRFNFNKKYKLAEGSHWLYLAHSLSTDSNSQPLAKITHITEPLAESMLADYVQSVIADSSQTTEIVFGDAVLPTQQQTLLQYLKTSATHYAPSELRHEFLTALQVCGFLESCNTHHTHKQFIHIDTDKDNHWSVIVIESAR